MASVKQIWEALTGVCLIGSCVLFRPCFRPWYSRWGASDEDIKRTLPGDEYIPVFRGGYTQAINIDAGTSSVWPWIVQIGQDKGGFYSYEILENMIGCKITNADRILPECQDIKEGDKLVMHPSTPGVPVASVKSGEYLLYAAKEDEDSGNAWVFHLTAMGKSTRLVSRWSFSYKPRLFNRVIYNWLLEPIAAVMQRKMLKEIKRLAEIEAKSSPS
ncbi:MAG: hypothetical protein JW712_12585 [Dehalococcoidales bacterium]|nr:hypothetical protein [Dehalococcoidales bacterium]